MCFDKLKSILTDKIDLHVEESLNICKEKNEMERVQDKVLNMIAQSSQNKSLVYSVEFNQALNNYRDAKNQYEQGRMEILDALLRLEEAPIET